MWSWTSLGAMLIASTVAAQTPPKPALQGAAVLHRSSVIASDVELARLQVRPRAELERLESEQRAACRTGATPACRAATQQLDQLRPGLQQKIASNEAHLRTHRPAGGCQGCHAAPGSSGAADPMQGGLPSAGGGSAGTSAGTAGSGSRSGTAGGSASTGTSNASLEPRAVRCFIATAAWGSPWADEVHTLRRFRDEQLMPHGWGRALVEAYYEASPPLAAWIAVRPWARAAARGLLAPMVATVRHPDRAVGAGLGLALAAAAWVAYRRRRRVAC